MSHTPGPWRNDDGCIEAPSGNVALCNLARQSRADAKLIAAAPDLLKALEGVLRVADRQTDEFDAARAAIAKARGE